MGIEPTTYLLVSLSFFVRVQPAKLQAMRKVELGEQEDYAQRSQHLSHPALAKDDQSRAVHGDPKASDPSPALITKRSSKYCKRKLACCAICAAPTTSLRSVQLRCNPLPESHRP